MEENSNKKCVVVVSGGFDPVHAGHVRLFKEAKKLGDELVVILNNDNWLKQKKDKLFMEQDERKEILEGFGAVDRVVLSGHEKDTTDMSICEDLKIIKPNVFANGGDRFLDNIPEVRVCEDIGCEMIFNVGRGGKVQSSSWLLKKYKSSGEGN